MRISDWSSDVYSSDLQAVDALVSAMAGRGLAPPTDSGLGLRDYVTIASGGNPDVAPRLQLRLARDGSLLPDPDALSIDFSRCEVEAREYAARSEEHTSELQSLMRNSYAVFCLKKKNKK